MSLINISNLTFACDGSYDFIFEIEVIESLQKKLYCLTERRL